jgi:hypothetical protein
MKLPLPYASERRFLLIQYLHSDGLLLLRSNEPNRHSKRIDIPPLAHLVYRRALKEQLHETLPGQRTPGNVWRATSMACWPDRYRNRPDLWANPLQPNKLKDLRILKSDFRFKTIWSELH